MSKKKNKGKRNSSTWKTICFLCFFCLLPLQAYSQIVPDIATIEAYIHDHKKQRALLLARSTLEQSNKLLHKTAAATNRDYRNINIELDKYTRAFDVVDLVFNTVCTGFNVYRTYDTIKDKIGKYKVLLQKYNEAVVKRGAFESADTLLLKVNSRAISNIASECENVYQYLLIIAGYATGKVNCSTATMSYLVENINNSLNRIQDLINAAYYRSWQFIHVRTSFWKAEIFRSKSVKQIANDAIERWMESGNILNH